MSELICNYEFAWEALLLWTFVVWSAGLLVGFLLAIVTTPTPKENT